MKYNFKWNEIKDAKWIFVVGTDVDNKISMMVDIAKHISENKPKVLKVVDTFYVSLSLRSYGYQRLDFICDYLQNHTNTKDSVIIEEIDSLIDAKLQRNLPEYLKTQCGIPPQRLIVSISNPLILLGAPKESVIILVEKKEDKLEASIFKIDNVPMLNPNILYTSPLFNVYDIMSDTLIDFSKYKTEDSWQEMENNDNLDKKLIELYNARKRT